MPKIVRSRGCDILVYFSTKSWYNRFPYENAMSTVAIIEGESQTTPNIHNNDINWGSIHINVQ